ncbi:YitT family protein [Terrilactibacillus laevilacticus]|uniref:YitT family protein n=1 Tax=Terrilactibacillus laevilacticus TaxID=1380157 RepID=UPI0015EFAEB8|nr:YitT family protein [Terrilactibacillus laevilacticus]
MQKKIITIAFASFLIAVAINGFIIPLHLLNGGFWGISILAHYLWGYKIALTFACLNIPIYLIAFKYNNVFFINGLLGTCFVTVATDLLSPLQNMINFSFFTSIVLGSLILGIGVGLMLKFHTSPGGMDLLALMLSRWFKINVGLIIFILDLLIITSGVILLQDEKIFYSLIIVFMVGIITMMMTSIRSIIFE